MRKTRLLKALSLILCFVLIAATALTASGCNGNKGNPEVTESADDTAQKKTVGSDGKKFSVSVTHGDGSENAFEVITDKETVGEALSVAGIISGEQGPYGLYVKTVDGETLDFDDDGLYWAFYIDGAYATSGADTTEVTEGGVYGFKAEK